MDSPDLVERRVSFKRGLNAAVSLNDPVVRYSHNPVLIPEQVNKLWKEPAFQVKTVHNAGITKYGDEIIMLFRSHLRNGMSILGLARSSNGIDGWKIDAKPALLPATENDSFAEGVRKFAIIESEAGGIADPRITRLEDTYLITYSAYDAMVRNKVRVSLATTRDFKSFLRYGPILDVDMRNVVIFPDKIGGQYVGLFRPNDLTTGDVNGIYAQIQIGYTTNWRSGAWQILRSPIIKTGSGPNALANKIGPGAPPLYSKHGWINIFHGVRTTMSGNPYVLSVALHDFKIPAQVYVSNIPILYPTAADCRLDEDQYVHVPQVVFTCGAIRKDDGTIFLYYGGNDTAMNLAITHEDVLAELCKRYGQHPNTGRPLYKLQDFQ